MLQKEHMNRNVKMLTLLGVKRFEEKKFEALMENNLNILKGKA